MAEGLLRFVAGHLFDVHSAGTVPAERVHPFAVQVMAEVGIDIGAAVPKSAAKYLGRLSVRQLIIVCEPEEKQSPRIFPGAMTREIWELKDPSDFEGPSDEMLVRFRQTRDEISHLITQWLSRFPSKTRASRAQLDRIGSGK
jgi:arsenate reductase